MTLTPEERKKFADWLRQDIASDEVILSQARRINASMFFKTREQEMAAKNIVLGILDGTEMQTIVGPGEPTI